MEEFHPYSSFAPAALALFPDAYAAAKPFTSMPVALRVRYAIAAFLSSARFTMIDVGVDIQKRDYWSQLVTFSQLLSGYLNATDAAGTISARSARYLGFLHGALTQMEYFLRFGDISSLTHASSPEEFRDAMSMLRQRTQKPEDMDGSRRSEILDSPNLWFDIPRILRDAVTVTGDALNMLSFAKLVLDDDVDFFLSLYVDPFSLELRWIEQDADGARAEVSLEHFSALQLFPEEEESRILTTGRSLLFNRKARVPKQSVAGDNDKLGGSTAVRSSASSPVDSVASSAQSASDTVVHPPSTKSSATPAPVVQSAAPTSKSVSSKQTVLSFPSSPAGGSTQSKANTQSKAKTTPASRSTASAATSSRQPVVPASVSSASQASSSTDAPHASDDPDALPAYDDVSNFERLAVLSIWCPIRLKLQEGKLDKALTALGLNKSALTKLPALFADKRLTTLADGRVIYSASHSWYITTESCALSPLKVKKPAKRKSSANSLPPCKSLVLATLEAMLKSETVPLETVRLNLTQSGNVPSDADLLTRFIPDIPMFSSLVPYATPFPPARQSSRLVDPNAQSSQSAVQSTRRPSLVLSPSHTVPIAGLSPLVFDKDDTLWDLLRLFGIETSALKVSGTVPYGHYFLELLSIALHFIRRLIDADPRDPMLLDMPIPFLNREGIIALAAFTQPSVIEMLKLCASRLILGKRVEQLCDGLLYSDLPVIQHFLEMENQVMPWVTSSLVPDQDLSFNFPEMIDHVLSELVHPPDPDSDILLHLVGEHQLVGSAVTRWRQSKTEYLLSLEIEVVDVDLSVRNSVVAQRSRSQLSLPVSTSAIVTQPARTKAEKAEMQRLKSALGINTSTPAKSSPGTTSTDTRKSARLSSASKLESSTDEPDLGNDDIDRTLVDTFSEPGSDSVNDVLDNTRNDLLPRSDRLDVFEPSFSVTSPASLLPTDLSVSVNEAPPTLDSFQKSLEERLQVQQRELAAQQNLLAESQRSFEERLRSQLEHQQRSFQAQLAEQQSTLEAKHRQELDRLAVETSQLVKERVEADRKEQAEALVASLARLPDASSCLEDNNVEQILGSLSRNISSATQWPTLLKRLRSIAQDTLDPEIRARRDPHAPYVDVRHYLVISRPPRFQLNDVVWATLPDDTGREIEREGVVVGEAEWVHGEGENFYRVQINLSNSSVMTMILRESKLRHPPKASKGPILLSRDPMMDDDSHMIPRYQPGDWVFNIDISSDDSIPWLGRVIDFWGREAFENLQIFLVELIDATGSPSVRVLVPDWSIKRLTPLSWPPKVADLVEMRQVVSPHWKPGPASPVEDSHVRLQSTVRRSFPETPRDLSMDTIQLNSTQRKPALFPSVEFSQPPNPDTRQTPPRSNAEHSWSPRDNSPRSSTRAEPLRFPSALELAPFPVDEDLLNSKSASSADPFNSTLYEAMLGLQARVQDSKVLLPLSFKERALFDTKMHSQASKCDLWPLFAVEDTKGRVGVLNQIPFLHRVPEELILSNLQGNLQVVLLKSSMIAPKSIMPNEYLIPELVPDLTSLALGSLGFWNLSEQEVLWKRGRILCALYSTRAPTVTSSPLNLSVSAPSMSIISNPENDPKTHSMVVKRLEDLIKQAHDHITPLAMDYSSWAPDAWYRHIPTHVMSLLPCFPSHVNLQSDAYQRYLVRFAFAGWSRQLSAKVTAEMRITFLGLKWQVTNVQERVTLENELAYTADGALEPFNDTDFQGYTIAWMKKKALFPTPAQRDARISEIKSRNVKDGVAWEKTNLDAMYVISWGPGWNISEFILMVYSSLDMQLRMVYSRHLRNRNEEDHFLFQAISYVSTDKAISFKQFFDAEFRHNDAFVAVAGTSKKTDKMAALVSSELTSAPGVLESAVVDRAVASTNASASAVASDSTTPSSKPFEDLVTRNLKSLQEQTVGIQTYAQSLDAAVKKQYQELSNMRESLSHVNQFLAGEQVIRGEMHGKIFPEPGGRRPPQVVPVTPPASASMKTPERPFSSDLPYGNSRAGSVASPDPTARVSPPARRLGGICREWLNTGKCDRPGCTYRHEDSSPGTPGTPRRSMSEQICAQFLATGQCNYEKQNGRRCRYKHVASDAVGSGMVASIYFPDVRPETDFFESDDDDPGERLTSSAATENAGV